MRHQVIKQKKLHDYHDNNVLLTARLSQVTCLLEQAYHDIHDLKVMLRELSNDVSHLLPKKEHVLEQECTEYDPIIPVICQAPTHPIKTTIE